MAGSNFVEKGQPPWPACRRRGYGVPMEWWPVGLVLFSAALLPAQAACNAATNRAIAHPVVTILISLLGSLLAISAFGVFSGRLATFPGARLGAVPWWAWGAGLGGAFFVTAQTLAVPRLGTALFASLAVTGQVAMALMLDHFGLLGLPVHVASPMRVVGAVLIVGGMVLVARF